MLRLIDRIECLEGLALKTELRLEAGRWQKWYWLDRPLNSSERAHLKFSAEDMRLLAFCRSLAAPFLSADMGRLLDDNLRRASALFAEGKPGEAGGSYVQPAMLGSIDYAPFAEMWFHPWNSFILPTPKRREYPYLFVGGYGAVKVKFAEALALWSR